MTALITLLVGVAAMIIALVLGIRRGNKRRLEIKRALIEEQEDL
jgi:hypothetical protein